MSTLELLLTGVGLSMDAFAVAICQGLCMPKINWRNAAVIALFFGGFQALMPLIGWLLGIQFQNLIVSVDHWIAFVLLLIIGVNMIREALGDREGETDASFSFIVMTTLAVATSIDALAVGITFAFLSVNIWLAAALIGVITFMISAAGVRIGNIFGTRFQKKAEILGGVILILIGTKILLEHLGLLSF